MANLGIPTKLLHESLGHIITVELKTGQIYRGKLFDGESTVPLSTGVGRSWDGQVARPILSASAWSAWASCRTYRDRRGKGRSWRQHD